MLCRLALVLFVAVLNISAFDAVATSDRNKHVHDLQTLINQKENLLIQKIVEVLQHGKGLKEGNSQLRKFEEKNVLRMSDANKALLKVTLIFKTINYLEREREGRKLNVHYVLIMFAPIFQ